MREIWKEPGRRWKAVEGKAGDEGMKKRRMLSGALALVMSLMVLVSPALAAEAVSDGEMPAAVETEPAVPETEETTTPGEPPVESQEPPTEEPADPGAGTAGGACAAGGIGAGEPQ